MQELQKLKAELVLGIDIGGLHITVGLIDLESGEIITDSLQRRELDCNSSAEVIFGCWCEAINEAYHGIKDMRKRIGVAMPGPFDYENGICLIKDQDKFKALYQLNIRTELASRLNMMPADITFINDAAAFLQGEVFAGAARGRNRVIGLTLGTGLGSSFCDNGIAEDADLWQSPFKEGIAEDYLSTRWFVKSYLKLTGKDIGGVKALTLISDEEIKRQIFEVFSHNLADFLAPLIIARNAETVVMGGNISNAFPLFLSSLNREFKEKGINVEVKIAELQENASLIGAASNGAIKYLNE